MAPSIHLRTLSLLHHSLSVLSPPLTSASSPITHGSELMASVHMFLRAHIIIFGYMHMHTRAHTHAHLGWLVIVL